MKRRLLARRPSPAMVVAFVALCSSVTGAAVAQSLIDSGDIARNAVKSKHIANGKVKNKDIRNNTVKTTKVRNGTLLAEDFRAGQLPEGQRGPEGPEGPQGDTGPIGPSTGYGASTPDNLSWTGSFQVVQTLNLPAGNYIVQGHVFSNNNTASNAIVDCDLQVNGVAIEDGDDLVRHGDNNAPAERLFLSQHGVVTLAAAGTVTTACDTDVATGSWSHRVLTAVQVGAIG